MQPEAQIQIKRRQIYLTDQELNDAAPTDWEGSDLPALPAFANDDSRMPSAVDRWVADSREPAPLSYRLVDAANRVSDKKFVICASAALVGVVWIVHLCW